MLVDNSDPKNYGTKGLRHVTSKFFNVPTSEKQFNSDESESQKAWR